MHKVDFHTVRKIGLSLPGVEESTTYGSPALKLRGKLLACIAVHRSAEPESLAVRIDFERRTDLIIAAPDIYYVTDHYVNYPVVLVRLSRIRPDALEDLLNIAWRFVTMKRVRSKQNVRKKPRQLAARSCGDSNTNRRPPPRATPRYCTDL